VLERLLEREAPQQEGLRRLNRYSDYKRSFHEAAIGSSSAAGIVGKNSADIRLVVDAMDVLQKSTSTASWSPRLDFSPCLELKENNKYVIGLGVKNSTSGCS
jgi:hypothetical protein